MAFETDLYDRQLRGGPLRQGSSETARAPRFQWDLAPFPARSMRLSLFSVHKAVLIASDGYLCRLISSRSVVAAVRAASAKSTPLPA